MQQVGQEVDDVRLKQPPQSHCQLLHSKQGPLAVTVVLPVLNGSLQCLHHTKLLQRRDTKSFDNTCYPVGRSLSLCI